MSAPATVSFCLCGHAERRHSDEDGCDNGACGCTVFRPDDGTRQPVVAVPTPSPVAAVKPPVTAATVPPVKAQHVCDCGRSFPTTHGLSVHRARSHKPAPDYAAIAAGIDTKSGTSEPVADADPDPEPEQRQTTPRERIWDERSITVQFSAGQVTLSYEVDWGAMDFATRNWLTELDSLLMRLGRVDLFAAIIGDPNAVEDGLR